MDMLAIFDLLKIPLILRSLPADPSPAQALDHFRQLQQVAKKHYRQLSMKHHPDKGGDPQIMKTINQAWEEFQQVRYLTLQRQVVVTINFSAFQVNLNRNQYRPDTGTGTSSTTADNLPF